MGRIASDKITHFFEIISILIKSLLVSAGASDFAISLIVDGILKGVSSVLSFVPELIILFTCISILETTGYMSRIALLLDQFFRKLGLSGKSLIPFIVGFGCSVPGIMSSRIIENEHERKMTAVLTPFIPCSAKLPMIVLFTSTFFKENSSLVSVSLYFFAIIVIIISSLIMKKFVFQNTSNTYISELPKYQFPNMKWVWRDVKDKVLSFIKRAGTTILLCSIVIWFLLSFSLEMQYGVPLQESIIAQIGNKISLVFYPMLGTNSWEATVSAIQGLVAKEQVVSSMAVISGLADSKLMLDNHENVGNTIFSKNSVFSFFTPVSAFAFVVFNLFSAPCFGAIIAMKRELGGFFKVMMAVAFQTAIAWLLGVLIYQVGHRIELGVFNVVDLFLLMLVCVIVIGVIIKWPKNEKCASCQGCVNAVNCGKFTTCIDMKGKKM
ncbi:MAG: hypothetical protein IJ215_03550 [Clostridia bacterium]|nr:hypothetical protein [Clostridia bacterium]